MRSSTALNLSLACFLVGCVSDNTNYCQWTQEDKKYIFENLPERVKEQSRVKGWTFQLPSSVSNYEFPQDYPSCRFSVQEEGYSSRYLIVDYNQNDRRLEEVSLMQVEQ
jgi:hypothetical protein